MILQKALCTHLVVCCKVANDNQCRNQTTATGNNTQYRIISNRLDVFAVINSSILLGCVSRYF